MSTEPEATALDPVAVRVAQNDALFRESNDRIVDVAQSLDMDDAQPLPIICECAEVSCTEIVHVTPNEYEAIRREPTWFINAPDHVRNGLGWARVVTEFEGFDVVEKIGDAAVVATELDPRTEEVS